MSPLNANYEYANAEQKYFEAEDNKEKLEALEEMLKTSPDHKSSQKFRGELKLKIKKLKEKLSKEKVKAKARGKSQQGIKKADLQAVIIGFTNTGKSSILKILTNAEPKIASYGFATTHPEQGILEYQEVPIQIVDLPPIGSPNFDKGIANTTDTLLVVIEKLHELEELKPILKKSKAKKIIVFNKCEKYDDKIKRKISETLKSKKQNFVLTSTTTGEGIEELKNKILKTFNFMRIYTKQPNKKEKEPEAMILKPGKTIEDAAIKALHSKSAQVKKAKIWGPSSKFGGQQVGLKHVLKDKDTIEFITK